MIKHIWKAKTAFLIGVVIVASGADAKGLGQSVDAVVLPGTDAIAQTNIADTFQSEWAMPKAVNGLDAPLRNNEPLLTMYPFDSKRAYKSEVIYARNFGKLDRIEVAP